MSRVGVLIGPALLVLVYIFFPPVFFFFFFLVQVGGYISEKQTLEFSSSEFFP